MSTNRADEFYTIARIHARNIMAAEAWFRGQAQIEWNALDYGNTLPNGTAQNAGLVAADVGAVVFQTADAIKVVFDAGHATNLSKLQ